MPTTPAKPLSSRPAFSATICHSSLSCSARLSPRPSSRVSFPYKSLRCRVDGLNLAHEFLEEVNPAIHLKQKRAYANTAQIASDAAHGVAFHRGLGAPLYPTLNTPLATYLNEESVSEFASSAYTKQNISVVANGANQAELGKWVGEFFGDVSTKGSHELPSKATKYYGGEERIAHSSAQNAFVIAFPGSSSFTAGSSYKPEIAVLAALLGGKSTIKYSPGFSLLAKAAASAPGANISTTHAAYSDAGLLTINFSGPALSVNSAAAEAVKALKSIADGSINKEEFTKAIALAKYRSLEEGQNIESGLVATGSGLIQGGKPFQIDQVTKSIESVSQESLKTVRNPFSPYLEYMLTFYRPPRHCSRARLVSLLLEIFAFYRSPRSLVCWFKGV